MYLEILIEAEIDETHSTGVFFSRCNRHANYFIELFDLVVRIPLLDVARTQLPTPLLVRRLLLRVVQRLRALPAHLPPGERVAGRFLTPHKEPHPVRVEKKPYTCRY